MTKNSYDKALDNAVKDLTDLLNQRALLDTRIAQLRQTVNSLGQLRGSRESGVIDPVADMGLAEACLEVLRAGDRPLTGLEVKRGLEKMGFDLSRYTNPLATIYPTLNRLADKGKVEADNAGDKHTYRIKPLGFMGTLMKSIAEPANRQVPDANARISKAAPQRVRQADEAARINQPLQRIGKKTKKD